MTRRVLVVGTGLIGTSVGLALRGDVDVLLDDESGRHLEDAVARGAGRRWDGQERCDLAVACVPPSATPELTARLVRAGVATTVTHVASAQSRVQVEIEEMLGEDTRSVCGGHPLAGRETRGPRSASARLFWGRPWAVCPGRATTRGAVEDVRWLAEACGATPIEMSAEEHDAAVALVSHLPQVAASAVAARLVAEPGRATAAVIAGPGMHDTTRIAGSDAQLWLDILRGNAGHVAPLVRALSDDLRRAADALDALTVDSTASEAASAIIDLLERGQDGRRLLPLKAGAPDRSLTSVVVSVPDEPGQLAAVLAAAAAAGINVEDVRVEHLPGRPRGLLELVVAEQAAGPARRVLAAGGWEIVGS